MERKTRIWLGLGVAVLGSATAAGPSALAIGRTGLDDQTTTVAPPALGVQVAQEEGEGGEGGPGEGGAITIADYRLRSTDPQQYAYDATEQVAAFGNLASQSYTAAHAGAIKLQDAVTALLANPTAQTLADARTAWVTARAAYMQTEVFRFNGTPIDDGERRIAAWPIREAFLDYVQGKTNTGLVNDPTAPMTLETVVVRNQATDPENVTTGWHAIEFLLWGQDLSATGPGARPVSDYIAGQGNDERRREYLKIATGLLVNDLGNMVAAWAPERENFRSSLNTMDARNVIGHAFHGMAVLAGFELASKRIGYALDGVEPEYEPSRFSDNTITDYANDVRGIRNVYFGGKDKTGTGFDVLVAKLDPDTNKRVIAALDTAEKAVATLDSPYDSILASPPGSPARAKAEAAVSALSDLAEALQAAGNRLGVLVLTIPKTPL